MKSKKKRLTMPVFVSENKEIYRQWREWQGEECDKIESQAKENGTLDAELSQWLLQRRSRIPVGLNDNVIPGEEPNNPASNVPVDKAAIKPRGGYCTTCGNARDPPWDVDMFTHEIKEPRCEDCGNTVDIDMFTGEPKRRERR